jgi:hypothetical protein
MHERWYPAIIVAALVAAMFYALHADLSSPSSPSRQAERAQQAQQERPQGNNQNRESKTIFSGVTVLDLAELVLAASTVGLWIVTGRSVRIAERSLVDVERALVVVTDVSVSSLIRTNRIFGYRMTIMLTNTGRTVGTRLITNANVVVFDGDDSVPVDFRYPDRSEPSRNLGLVGPSVKLPIPLDIALQDIVDVQQKQKTGIIYGWAEYNDIFTGSIRRRTEFCARIEVVGDPRRMPTELGGLLHSASPLMANTMA